MLITLYPCWMTKAMSFSQMPAYIPINMRLAYRFHQKIVSFINRCHALPQNLFIG